jgi:hypothetical protein
MESVMTPDPDDDQFEFALDFARKNYDNELFTEEALERLWHLMEDTDAAA